MAGFGWLSKQIVELPAAVRRLTSARYGVMAERLGRPSVGSDRKRGFVMVQIDGLSREHLEQAMAAGYMPYVGRLLAGGMDFTGLVR